MPNLAQTLKQEIARISIRETNKLVSAQAKTVSELKRALVALKKRIAELEKAQKPVEKALARIQPEIVPAAKPEKAAGKWFTSNGIRAIRKRLGLTQAQLEKLAGVSEKTVAKWEGKKGKIGLRPHNVGILAAIREMSKQEAMAKLGLDKEKATGEQPVKQSAGTGFTGQDVLALRKRLGLSQREFAKRLGMSQKGVSHWETKQQKELRLKPKSLQALDKMAREKAGSGNA